MAKDIYEKLKKEHNKIKKAFSNMLKKPSKRDWDIIKNGLTNHFKTEERELYPQLKEFEELRDRIIESIEEQKHSKMILRDLERMDIHESEFKPKLKFFKELFDHHIYEEEHEIFPIAQSIVSFEQEKEISENYEDTEERINTSRVK